MHALIGAAARRVAPKRTWLVLGVILGNMFPDLDNYAVAVATLAGADTHGLHRTFTHSVFTILAILVGFFLIARLRGDDRWNALGIGLGIGVGMHMAVDMLVWFNGVELLWPLGTEYNFWTSYEPPGWLYTFVSVSAEFLFFWLYLLWLGRTARHQATDGASLQSLAVWTNIMLALFLVFLPLSYLWPGYFTIYGALYLVALTAVFVITIRMRATVEAI
jgi:hypothetical protein